MMFLKIIKYVNFYIGINGILVEKLQYINIEKSIRINKYLPAAILYFFFNSFLLPLGLLYTTILTPLLLLWLYQYRTFHKLWLFFVFIIPYAVIHFLTGVDAYYYVVSTILFFTVFVFIICFYQFLKVCLTLRTIFRKIIVINFILVIIACFAFFIPGLKHFFWQVSAISSGLDKLPRLKLLTYEPSFYSLLLAPIAIYYYLKIIFLRIPNPALIIILVTVPLLLSFSLGILMGIPLALVILFVLNLKLFFVNKKIPQYIFLILSLALIVFLLLAITYPDNPLFIRIFNLFEGKDSSFKGRTVDSYELAWAITSKKNLLFGVGLGQVKVEGLELWRDYYDYNFSINEVAIPCAVAETFAVFGLAGLFIRLGLEIYFFFRTKVYTDYYRLAIFIFIFIYQFTGSYIMNIAEYVIWIMAFHPGLFDEFSKKNILKRTIK